jgi:D-aminopeptidase
MRVEKVPEKVTPVRGEPSQLVIVSGTDEGAAVAVVWWRTGLF